MKHVHVLRALKQPINQFVNIPASFSSFVALFTIHNQIADVNKSELIRMLDVLVLKIFTCVSLS